MGVVGKKAFEVEDKQLGFYLLLKGRCQLVFEVIKARKLEQKFESSEDGRDGMMRQIELYGGG